MQNSRFGDKPLFNNPFESAVYLGTWFGRDCYHIGDSLIVRYGDEDSQYGSYPDVGWNPYNPTSQVWGLGNGRNLCEVCMDSDDGKAQLAALAFLGRNYLDSLER